jgi:hypothetical protein
MDCFYFVTSPTVDRPNAGKDYDDVKITNLFIYVSESNGCSYYRLQDYNFNILTVALIT